jgi:hypothetical protein
MSFDKRHTSTRARRAFFLSIPGYLPLTLSQQQIDELREYGATQEVIKIHGERALEDDSKYHQVESTKRNFRERFKLNFRSMLAELVVSHPAYVELLKARTPSPDKPLGVAPRPLLGPSPLKIRSKEPAGPS